MKNEKTISYKECKKCDGVVTIVSEQKDGVRVVSTVCRTCGQTTSRVGNNGRSVSGGDGAYCIFYKDSDLQDFGSLISGLRERDLEKNIMDILFDTNVDTEKTYISIKRDGKIVAILGRLPLSFKDEMKNAMNNEEKIVSTEDVDKFFSGLKKQTGEVS